MKKWILGAALSGSLFTGANAENTNTVTEAERIVVTATRSASEVRTVPGNPSVVTAQDISDGHYTSVPEALEKKAGLFFRNIADNPSQASVDIRGFGGDNPHGKVLVLVNPGNSPKTFNLQDQARTTTGTVNAGAVATLVWR